ncbi:uncharacterized protein V6R79_011520 [Siganus canaliculatus]
MSRKALKAVVELNFRAVSCPGVHLPTKDDVFLSMCFLGQYRQSECLPAVFPLLFHEKMTFEKIFRYAVDPGDIAIMLEYETIRIELVQLIPSVGDTLACFEEDARSFLFPEPKLVPSFSGVDREVLMTRAPHFPGIAPRLEFSTKTTIIECSADAEVNIYPNVSLRPVGKRIRKNPSRPTTASPQRKLPHSLDGTQDGGTHRESRSSTRLPFNVLQRSQSLSPLRAGNAQRLARLSLDSAVPHAAEWNGNSTFHPVRTTHPYSQPADGRVELLELIHIFMLFISLLFLYLVQSRNLWVNRCLVWGTSEDNCSFSETHGYIMDHPEPSALWQSYREEARHRRLRSSSHREWEEVQERVRGLITTPKAVRRLVYGATHSEIDSVLSRRSISPGPP